MTTPNVWTADHWSIIVIVIVFNSIHFDWTNTRPMKKEMKIGKKSKKKKTWLLFKFLEKLKKKQFVNAVFKLDYEW